MLINSVSYGNRQELCRYVGGTLKIVISVFSEWILEMVVVLFSFLLRTKYVFCFLLKKKKRKTFFFNLILDGNEF